MNKTRTDRNQSRFAFALAVLLALAGLSGAIRAQAQDVASASVSAWCEAPAADGSTACAVSATGGDTVTVPYAAIPDGLIGTSGTDTGAGYSSAVGDPTVSFTFSAPVAAGGGASYTVSSGDVVTEVGGAAFFLIEAPAPAVESEITEVVTEATEEVPTEVVTEEIVVDEDVPGEATPVVENTAVAPANVIIDPSVTPGTPPTEVVPATITINSYLCETDPGSTDPITAGCVVAAGVPYTARDASGELGTSISDGAGTTSFTSSVGSTFVVAQGNAAALAGYAPRGDGRYEIQSVTGATTISFVNVKKAELGRLQIVGGLCPTTGESRTEFTIVDPNTISTAAIDTCMPNNDAVFVLTSTSLPGGAWTVRLDSAGVWRGYIPAGTYVVTAPDGTSSDSITVLANRISVSVAMTYVAQETGTLTLEHFLCTEGTDGEVMVVNPSEGPGASCSPSGATLSVKDVNSGASATTVTIAQNGSTSFNFKPGTYQVTSNSGLATATVEIVASETSVVRLITTSTTGVLMIQTLKCNTGLTPDTVGEFETDCTAIWGNTSLTLTGPSGQAVTTTGGGVAILEGLLPGSYTLTGADVCGIFNGNSDAGAGFSIVAGGTTTLMVYGCFADDGTGGGGTPGTQTPGDGTGNPEGPGNGGNPIGDGTGIGENTHGYGSNDNLNVSQLPNTGAGAESTMGMISLLLMVLAALVAVAGFQLRRNNR